MVTKQVKNTRLVEDLQLKRTFGLEYQQQFHQGWFDYMKMYLNQVPRQNIPNEFFGKRSQLGDPYRMIETWLPHVVLQTFSSPQWYSVTSPEAPSGGLYERNTHALLLEGWDQADMFEKSIEIIKESLILGSSLVKNFWETRIGPKELLVADPESNYDGDVMRLTIDDIIFEGPQTHSPDLLNVILDPTPRNAWAIERDYPSIDELDYENRVHGGRLYDSAELKKAANDRKSFPNRSQSGHRKFGDGGYATGPYNAGSLLEFVAGMQARTDATSIARDQFWTWVHPDRYEYPDTQWRLITILNNKYVIRDVVAPSPDRHHPFVICKSIPIPRRMYGESPLYFVKDLIELRQFIEDARREEVVQKLWTRWIVDENSTLSPEEFFVRPGGMLFVGNHLGKIQDTIKAVDTPDVMPSAYNESSVRLDQMDRTAGTTDLLSGTPLGGRTTATEANILANFAGGRVRLAGAYLDETYKKRVLQAYFELFRSRLTSERQITLQGSPRRRAMVSMRDLLWAVTIRVDSQAFGSIDANILQGYREIFALAKDDPESMMFLNRGEIYRDLLFRLGDPGMDRKIRSDDEVAKLMAAAQQQQQEQVEQQLAAQERVDANKEMAKGFAASITSGGGA